MNPDDLKKYTASEVKNLADLDKYMVRDEGHRRQEIAGKKIDKLRKQLAAALAEMAEAHEIIKAAADQP